MEKLTLIAESNNIMSFDQKTNFNYADNIKNKSFKSNKNGKRVTEVKCQLNY